MVARVRRRTCALFLCALACCACRSAPQREREREREGAPAATAATAKLRTLAAPPAEPILALVQREAERERREGRTLLVYVGASWCEPCQRFHQAAESGQLDATFPKLTLLGLDRDRDEARLVEAGCISRYIPLFAVPDASGHCSTRQIEGSIKGDGAVAEITPRLLRLLR